MAAEQDLIDLMAECSKDPLKFVIAAFPWAEAGSELQDKTGPRQWQRDVLTEIGVRLKAGESPDTAIKMGVASGHGIGKALRPEAMVPTPFGFQRVADIRQGSTLFGEYGQPVRVLATRAYETCPFFMVRFSDGTSAEVSSGHLWKVRGRNSRRTDGAWSVMSTADILAAGVLRANGASLAKQWEVPRAQAVEYPSRDLPVDPYTYGVWLGDGTKSSGRVTNIDEDVWLNLPYEFGKPYRQTKTLLGLKRQLVEAGLFGCTTYTASVDRRYMESAQRLSVLQGLLDTDGWVEKCGGAAFASASRQLTKDVIELCRSLGLRAREETFKPNDHAGSWQTHITWDGDIRLFRIARKQSALVAAEARYTANWIESIEPVNDGPGICFEVDGGLFLTEQFIVTHNSALVAWLVLWAISTRENTRGVVTANTANQLATKTWPEVSKWYRMLICKHWFNMQATGITSQDSKYEKTWRIDAVTWSDENLEAFAGLHNEGSRIILIMDEASNISDPVWEVAEGAMTDANTEIMWMAFGNPTRTEGRFRECFRKYKHRWWTRHVDSRTVEGTNKAQMAQWAADHGEDSDFMKVRVRGLFPDKSTDQFIPSDIVEKARTCPAEFFVHEPLIMGGDIARYGKDSSVVWLRRGNDARLIQRRRFQQLSLMELADQFAAIINQYRPDCVCLDETGVGGGVVDRLRQLGHEIVAVNFASKPPGLVDGVAYANMRSYLWGKGREWLRRGGAIPDEADLQDQLTTTGYHYNIRNEIVLTPKDELPMSPDDIDSLFVGFAVDPGPRRGFEDGTQPTGQAIDTWSLWER